MSDSRPAHSRLVLLSLHAKGLVANRVDKRYDVLLCDGVLLDRVANSQRCAWQARL